MLKAFDTPLVIEDLPEPSAGAGELVVDVVAAPVLSYARDVFSGERHYPLQLPMAVGCGAIGRVRAVGPDATRVANGDWIFCDPAVRSRDDAVTPDVLLQGWMAPAGGAQTLQKHFRQGPFAERLLIPLENAVRVGPLDPREAGLWCALMTLLVPFGGLLAANLQAGETTLISGATGHFGSAGVAVALAMGARCVIAPGRNEAELARLRQRFGERVVTVVLKGDEDNDRQTMQSAAPTAIDKVLDLLPPISDSSPTRAAVMSVRSHGTAVLMGGVRGNLELPYGHLMRNCITVRGQYMYPREAPARLIALIRCGLLSLSSFEVSDFPLEQANQAVAQAAEQAGPFKLTVIRP